MLFNSIEFAFFLPVVFFIYWLIVRDNIKLQNTFLLLASYFFYGWWDWRFLSLIIFSSFIDFSVGRSLAIYEEETRRKILLLISITVNLGLLGFFKYYNFFIDSLAGAFTLFGQNIEPKKLNIILPVGISFYTFQTMSYTIDVYRRKLNPTNDIVAFFAYVSFFPQLVAGPIERAGSLLPQFFLKRKFDYEKSVDGLRQILWGLFKKVVIADSVAIYVDDIYSNFIDYNGSTLLFGTVLFAFQIYCDFSGYSDIAIGSARLLGFSLMRNFAFPYFSRDIAEFWRRWHISLSTWLRDYLFLPIAYGTMRKITDEKFWCIKVEIWSYSVGMAITMLICGIWHGANWTFIAWGLLFGIYSTVGHVTQRFRKRCLKRAGIPQLLMSGWRIFFTFLLVCLAWIFFRSDNLAQAYSIYHKILSSSLFELPQIRPKDILILLLFFIIIEWLQREKEHALQFEGIRIPKYMRLCLYYIIIGLVLWNSSNQLTFIYFQF